MEGASEIWNRFDFKAACLFTGYRHREGPLKNELERVGLEDTRILWQFPTPFDEVLKRRVYGRMGLKKGFFNSGMGHYRAIKTAYELGVGHSLIMEDDVRFLSDVERLADIVKDLPEDYDIALLDTFKPQKMPLSECVENRTKNMVSRHWCRFSSMRSFACYAMSRKAMCRWISLWEDAFVRRQQPLRVADQYLNQDRIGRDMNLYHAVPNAAIQAPAGMSNSGSAGCFDCFYRDFGIDVSEYAIS